MSDWQPIETAPKDTKVVFGYFGPNELYFGAAAVGHLFQWETMPEALETGWAFSERPTHWMLLPSPPSAETPISEPSDDIVSVPIREIPGMEVKP